MSAPRNAVAPAGIGAVGCGRKLNRPLSPVMKYGSPITTRPMAGRKRVIDFVVRGAAGTAPSVNVVLMVSSSAMRVGVCAGDLPLLYLHVERGSVRSTFSCELFAPSLVGTV